MASPEFKPFRSIHEFLTAVHIYTGEAEEGKTRYVEATHYCAHVTKGVEYMVPKHVYDKFPPEEQKLWHSHDFEVKSGMLILPKPSDYSDEKWEAAELEAMKEIIHLYGKTWHFWQIDAGHEYPLGHPMLMGAATRAEQIDLILRWRRGTRYLV
ncbi:hypothetical protein KC356_g8266 [Hortaea werneckii]|nr:hypothetical protein KC356_g8266 [Hortaea werneckii]